MKRRTFIAATACARHARRRPGDDHDRRRCIPRRQRRAHTRPHRQTCGRRQSQRALAPRLRLLVGGADPQAYDLFHPANAPEGMLVMIQQDVLTSITLRNNTTLRTDRGFGVGSSAAEIKTACGASAFSEPHKYVAGAEYITIWTTGAPATPGAYVQDTNARGVRYETNAQGVVTAVHAGGASIQNVEGCS